MAVLSKQDVSELRRIVKEATGRNLSLGQTYALCHHLTSLLRLLGVAEAWKEEPLPPHQDRLFPPLRKKR